MISRTTLLSAALLLVACGDSAAGPDARGGEDELASTLVADGDALFQSDTSVYRFSASGDITLGTVSVTFTNRTPRPANFVNCHGSTGVLLQRWTDDRWESVWSPILPMCLSAPIVVAPGHSRQFTLGIAGGAKGSNRRPQFEAPLTHGAYRIVFTNVVFDYQDRLPFGAELPAALRVSNRFVIVPPGGV